jgi:L-ascorbate 6-phosphate lactonase
MTLERWLKEFFPHWGKYLNQQIETTVPEKGKVAFWWLGRSSWALKSNQDTFLIDNSASSSTATRYDSCGVCQTTGAGRLHWRRLNPQVVDIWKFKRINTAFSTHHHADHCDIYTVKTLLATTEALFVGPKITCQIFRNRGVPEQRIREVRPGGTLKFQDTEVVVEKNYDQMVIKATTDLDSPSGAVDMDGPSSSSPRGATSPSSGTPPTSTPSGVPASARFIYPDYQDIGCYNYPDWVERYNWERSIDYGAR